VTKRMEVRTAKKTQPTFNLSIPTEVGKPECVGTFLITILFK